MAEYNFVSVINVITRKHDNGGSNLDHIFMRITDNVSKICLACVRKLKLIDYFATALCIKGKEYFDNNTNPLKRCKKFIDHRQIKQYFKTFNNWNEFYRIIDINVITNYFINTLKNIEQKHTKFIKVKFVLK